MSDLVTGQRRVHVCHQPNHHGHRAGDVELLRAHQGDIATAGNSLCTSGVAVNRIEMTSSLVSAFASRIDETSSRVEDSTCSRSSTSSWMAPLMARTVLTGTGIGVSLTPATVATEAGARYQSPAAE